MMAAANGHDSVVEFLLKKDKIDVDSQNNSKNTALHWAALMGKKSCVEKLLAAKADANITNEFDKKPFDDAFGKSHSEVCEILAPATEFPQEDEPEEMKKQVDEMVKAVEEGDDDKVKEKLQKAGA